MIISNIIVSLLGFLLGFLVLKNNLAIFNKHLKTPVVETWLVMVGTLAWSLALFSAIGCLFDSRQFANNLSHQDMLARCLFFIFWCGQLLKVKKYCLIMRKRKLRKMQQI